MGELLRHLAEIIDQHRLTETTLTGQLTGLRRTRAWGHADLVTPDADGGDDYTARILLGVPGRTAAAIESRLGPSVLAATPTVVVTGGLEIHPRYGPLRFVVRTLHLDHAATARTTAGRDAALGALSQLGLFTRRRHLALPETVTAIGLITGGSTAALADFEERIARLDGDHHLHVLEVATAGPGAPQAIAHAIARLDRRGLDCIAVIRGGGAPVDVSAFDHPDLVTAAGQAVTPILTGIGHATDTTLADRATHLALPTHSAVADHIGRHNTAGLSQSRLRLGCGPSTRLRPPPQRSAVSAAQAAAVEARLRVALALCAVLAVLVVALALF